MTDKFEEAAGKLARIGVSQIPVVGLLAEVVEAFLPPGADARLREAVENDLHESVRLLQKRVEELAEELQRQGLKLEQLGAARTIKVFRDFVAARTGADSPEQIDALINATAGQFDPRLGAPATRAYWLGVVRELSPIRIMLLRLMHQHEGLKIQVKPRPAIRSLKDVPLKIEDADVVALLEAGKDWTLIQRGTTNGGVLFRLGHLGQVAVQFI
jgi:hypothetical protein